MKFKCGPSLGQRYDARQKRIRNWHLWFAWRPVRVRSGLCVWFENVWRKNNGPGCVGGWDEWEYRL